MRQSLAVKTYTETNSGQKDQVARSTVSLANLEKKTNVVEGISSPKGSFRSPRGAKSMVGNKNK